MHYGKFLLYTTIGAAAWHAILAGLGWYMHSFVPENELEATIELYGDYIKWGIVIIVLLAALFFAGKRYFK